MCCLFCSFFAMQVFAQKNAAPKPLYDDPVYHGAADPVIIYNKQKKKWWMFYTNRRASIIDSTVQWVHGIVEVYSSQASRPAATRFAGPPL